MWQRRLEVAMKDGDREAEHTANRVLHRLYQACAESTGQGKLAERYMYTPARIHLPIYIYIYIYIYKHAHGRVISNTLLSMKPMVSVEGFIYLLVFVCFTGNGMHT